MPVPEPGSAAERVLALQRTAGNRAVVQRLALTPPGKVGEVLLGLDGLHVSASAAATREIALGESSAAGFDGYATVQEAAIAAGSSANVGVVVVDGAGRFHAYETDLPPVSSALYVGAVPFVLGAGRVVRWTHLTSPGDPSSTAERLKAARDLTHRKDAEGRAAAARAHLRLLTVDVGLAASDVHDSTGGKALPGKVSFDLDHTDSAAHAGVAGALPADRTSSLPEPTLEVGPRAFSNLPELRATLLHEFSHQNHAALAIAALRQWRAAGGKSSFETWLKGRHKAGAFQDVQYAIIREQVTPHAESTESLSYLRGFLASYHLRDLDEVGTGEVADAFLFRSLGDLAGEWLRAAHAVQDEVLRQLLDYRSALPEAHRSRLDEYVARRRSGAGGNLRLFWDALSS
jgi:hypothetical protein